MQKCAPGQLRKAQAARQRGGNGGGGTSAASPLDSAAESFRSSDVRWVADANYKLKRFTLAVQFNIGIDNYIKTQAGSSASLLKDRNEAIQISLRYYVLNFRRKEDAATTSAIRKMTATIIGN